MGIHSSFRSIRMTCKALSCFIVLAFVASISLAQRRYQDQRYSREEQVDYYGRYSGPYYNPRYRGYYYDQREYDNGDGDEQQNNFALADEYEYDSEYDPFFNERSEENRSAERDEKKKIADKKKDVMEVKNKKKGDNKATVALADEAMEDVAVKKTESRPATSVVKRMEVENKPATSTLEVNKKEKLRS